MEKLTHLDIGKYNKQLLELGDLKKTSQWISPVIQSGAYIQNPDSQVLAQQPFVGSYMTCWNVDRPLEFPKTPQFFS
jgi:hypothetical protein